MVFLITGTIWIELAVLFVWIFFTSLGLPGALIFMVSLGAAANNVWELIPLMLAASIAGILGDITAYELARKFLSKLSGKLEKFKFYYKNKDKARDLLKRYEFSAVFFTRFALTQLCAATSYISGFERLNRKKFISAVILGEIIYASLYPILGFIFKETWNDLIKILNYVFIAIVLMIIALALLIRLWVRNRRKIKELVEISG